MKRIWKPIPETNKLYWVSNDGKVQSRRYNKRKELHQSIVKKNDRPGHLRVCIVNNKGDRVKYLVHRLVGLLFIPNPENKPQINHIDGNKKNNHYTNLEWCTGSENMIHSFKVLKQGTCNNTWSKAENNPGAKLNWDQVNKIRELYKTGEYTQKQLGQQFNVNRLTILSIINNKRWKR